MSFGKLLDLVASDLSPAMKTVLWRVLITILVGVHVAWACGWLPGISGFAMADDLKQMNRDISRLEQTIACNLIETEINRLRAELRSVETEMFSARQDGNQDLLSFLQNRVNQISDEIGDHVDKRRANRCAVQ